MIAEPCRKERIPDAYADVRPFFHRRPAISKVSKGVSSIPIGPSNDKLNIHMALKDGIPVHVADVDRGLACNCVCAACGEPMMAKQGKIRAWHFAHASGRSCSYGLETSLHLEAKEILSEAGAIHLPSVRAEFPFSWKDSICVVPHMPEEIVSVELEKRCGNVVPDVVVRTAAGYELFVEIAVTHYIDDAKLEKLEALGVPTLEMDLGRAVRAGMDPEDAIAGRSVYKRWAYHPSVKLAYGAILRAAERYDAIGGRIVGCPKVKSAWNGKACADPEADCAECGYCIEMRGDHVMCTGDSMVFDTHTLWRAGRHRDPRWTALEIARHEARVRGEALEWPVCERRSDGYYVRHRADSDYVRHRVLHGRCPECGYGLAWIRCGEDMFYACGSRRCRYELPESGFLAMCAAAGKPSGTGTWYFAGMRSEADAGLSDEFKARLETERLEMPAASFRG